MTTRTKASTFTECLELMDEEVRDAIREQCSKHNATGVIIFECVDLSSSLIGDKFAIPYGPDNTIKSVPKDGRCPVTPPRGSAWQFYVKAYSENCEIS